MAADRLAEEQGAVSVVDPWAWALEVPCGFDTLFHLRGNAAWIHHERCHPGGIGMLGSEGSKLGSVLGLHVVDSTTCRSGCAAHVFIVTT
jgi:hypothetical protein